MGWPEESRAELGRFKHFRQVGSRLIMAERGGGRARRDGGRLPAGQGPDHDHWRTAEQEAENVRALANGERAALDERRELTRVPVLFEEFG